MDTDTISITLNRRGEILNISGVPAEVATVWAKTNQARTKELFSTLIETKTSRQTG